VQINFHVRTKDLFLTSYKNFIGLGCVDFVMTSGNEQGVNVHVECNEYNF